jgi:hypothetical protein
MKEYKKIVNKFLFASFDLFDDGMQQVNFDIYHKIESILPVLAILKFEFAAQLILLSNLSLDLIIFVNL